MPAIRHYLFLFAAQLMVAINIVGSKYLLVDFPMFYVLLNRFVIAAAMLAVLHLLHRRFSPAAATETRLSQIGRQEWWVITTQALCAGALFNLLLLVGLQSTSASVAGVITSMLPAIVAVMSVIFLRERLTLNMSLCVGLATLGLVVVNIPNLAGDSYHTLWGDLVILLALFPEGAYYILAKRFKITLPTYLYAMVINLINIPVLLPLMCYHHDFVHMADMTLLQEIVLLIVGASSAGFYAFWSLGCRQVSGTHAALTTAAMPVLTLLIAGLCLSEHITGLQLLGMVLVVGSITFGARSGERG